ncbi:hypothetical protein SGQ44_10680 [Flavobacterium sp. Fl-77]|uniref:Lipoprotein n=1 Tax=Flavobacterium flavipigmentatum TaxID=2893884 RepID=A0AAJ2SGU0_9FLAO|nr:MULTISPECIES: hypothetical protein [unclassified Flavobacterium]MDX6182594.1 hypothetical protein [Flavobacterium sp. Fl-33]MDX6186226.1 hypothetical protein [Flavobacterium sp. Fl-77]UFH38373.1 hypothetical protein LNP22_16770 [Flavobacterium sp. F-70]
MSKNLNRIVFMFFSVLVLVSCRTPKPVLSEEKTKTITIKEILHDTIFKIEKDSSTFRALLECQNGKVVFKNVTQVEPGRTLKSPKVRLDNNKLIVDCELKKQELYAFWKSQQVKEVEVKTVNTTKFINQLTFWQKVQIWLGRIFLLILIYYVGRFLLRFYRII